MILFHRGLFLVILLSMLAVTSWASLHTPDHKKCHPGAEQPSLSSSFEMEVAAFPGMTKQSGMTARSQQTPRSSRKPIFR